MKKTFVILFLFAAAEIFTGCSSAPAKNSRDAVKAMVKHEIKYSNEGTKSEGRSGYITINGVLIPDCFRTVAAGGKVYTFKTKSTIWGDDGYFPEESESVEQVYPSVNKKLSDDDIARGWSEVPERYLNVPDGWVFVIWGSGSAAVSPEKINELIKARSIKQILRNTMFSDKMLKY